MTANGEPGAQRFVWGKKIEKDIQSGASIKDFTKKAEQERQRQREVSALQMTCGASTQDSRLSLARTCFCKGPCTAPVLSSGHIHEQRMQSVSDPH